MEFWRNNWARLVIAVLLAGAGVVYIVALAQSTAPVHIFRQTAGQFTALVFLFGFATFLVCRMFSETWPKWILLCVGVLTTIFAVAFKIYVLGNIPRAFTAFEYLALTHACLFLVVLGLMPLIHGLSKILLMCRVSRKGTVKSTPVKAPAK